MVLKKVFKLLVIGYLFYCLFIVWYLYFGVDQVIPLQYKGTAADPVTFMTDKQLELSYEYSRLKFILYFITIPFEWLIILYIITFGFSTRLYRIATSVFTKKWMQIGVYLLLFLLSLAVAMLPLRYIRYMLAKSYGIGKQPLLGWLKDYSVSFGVEFLIFFLIGIVVYWLFTKHEKQAWLYGWFILVPFAFFFMWVQPILIDPLYNEFIPLEDRKLEMEILSLAHQAGIETERVFQVNVSGKTTALNAYVTGIGDSARIVLWDTTLTNLQNDEIIFIMAHEIGHYVMNHIYVGIIGYLLLSLLLLFLLSKIYRWFIQRYGKQINIKGFSDIKGFPVLLLLFSIIMFTLQPAANLVARYQEHQADVYAIELTKDPEAAIRSFQSLTVAGLQEVNPPQLVKWFVYTHPTMLERLNFLAKYEK